MVWNVKAIYPSGGHLITDRDSKVLRFKSELEAKTIAEILNKEGRTTERSYIVVPENI